MKPTLRRWLGYALAAQLLTALAATTSWGQCTCTTTLSGSGAASPAAGSTVCIAPGTTYSGTLTISASNVTVCNQGTFAGTISVQAGTTGTVLRNAGQMNGSPISLNGPTTIDNASGATWNLYVRAGANLRISNAGTWQTKVEEAGSSPTISITHNGGSWTGDIGGGSGSLQLTNNATWTRGFLFPSGPGNRFVTAAGATTDLAGYLGTGGIVVLVNSGTLNLNNGMGALASGSSLLNETGRPFYLRGDLTSSGPLTNRGTMTLTGNLITTSGVVITNRGALTVGGVLTNAGTLDSNSPVTVQLNLTNTFGANIMSGAPLTVSGQLDNQGTLMSNAELRVQLNFNNSGTATTNGPTTEGAQFSNSGTFTNAGTYTGSTLNFTNSGTYTTTGMLELNGAFLNSGNFANRGRVRGITYFANSGNITGGATAALKGFFRASGYTENGGNFGADGSYLDFCDSGAPGTGFDARGGTIGPNVSFCQFPLPVSLISFAARFRAGQVQLAWATASELNSSHFDVERSADGKDFTPIATVAAAGSSATVRHYEAPDPHPLPGLSYYRLHQLDADGSGAYSAAVAVQLEAADQPRLYPNPTQGLLSLDLRALPATPCTVRLLDVLGRTARETTLPGGQDSPLDLSPLPAGTYLLVLEAPGQATLRQRVVKQ